MYGEKLTVEKLHRSRSNKIIGGVCGGLGESLNIDPTIIRLVFAAALIFFGVGPLVYLVLWIIMPME